ncbi:hypothetical protein RRG08_015399 [Elysia crispata]|uniref:C-type lectin domain-containing protein n=1 Tax=Elysia crispata TaxID=231223 RepID=A0AAE1ATI8_9GAST|nr:hypothetical protein RRG08_015399 [Elysia crispata]
MLSFGYLFICAFLTVAVAQQKCAPGWITGPSSCYLLTDEHAFFVDGPEYYFSEIYCNDRYSHGAEIASKEENDFLKSWLSTAINDSTEIVRVGGKDWLGKNRWKWDHSDEKFGFSDWADNPGSSGDCLNLSPKFGFSWVPEDCDKTENLKFICEQELCKQPMECFQGSCYTLHCSLHEAKSSGVQFRKLHSGVFSEPYPPLLHVDPLVRDQDAIAGGECGLRVITSYQPPRARQLFLAVAV